MSFDKAMNKMKFDTRLLEYNFSQGYISKEDYNKYLTQLEDCSHLIEEDIEEDTAETEGDDTQEQSTSENH